MDSFFDGYGSLLFLAGIIGFMVWAHSRGRSCGMGGCGSHGHAEEQAGDDKIKMTDENRDSVNSGSSKGGSYH